STYNPSTYWHVEVYEGNNCNGELVMGFTDSYPPDSPGGTAYGATILDFNDSGDFSLRIRAADTQGCGPAPWSGCAPVHIEEPFEIISLPPPLHAFWNGPADVSMVHYTGSPAFPVIVNSVVAYCDPGMD